MIVTPLQVPDHLRQQDREEITENNAALDMAFDDLLDALQAAYPNGRDYSTNARRALAYQAHFQRIKMITEIRNDFLEVAFRIDQQ
jgi:hypothetical protein